MDPGEIGLAKQSIFEQNALEDQPEKSIIKSVQMMNHK